MPDRYTLDASDWPLVINDGDTVMAVFPTLSEATQLEAAIFEHAQVERANAITRFLNETEAK